MSPSSLSPVSASGPTDSASAFQHRQGVFGRVESISGVGREGWIVCALAALALHFGGTSAASTQAFEIGRFADLVRSTVSARLNTTIDVEEEAEPPEPEPEAEPEPEPEIEPEPETPPVPVPADPEAVIPESEPSAEAPPPAAAEAAEVLTAPADPNEPLDLTADGFITGTGTRFAGGVTASNGTAQKAVRNPGAVGGGVPGANGKTEGASGPPPVDKSRPAGLPVNANWRSCPFPPEADAESVNTARVRILVIVNPDGKPTSVNVLNDPGYGFGRAARSCAMRFSYPVGLDKKGNPTTRATKPFDVLFQR